MLEASGLRKSYGDLIAVNGVSLKAEKGQIIGLLGPNGAGKSTTVAMIAGLIRPDAGEVRIEGRLLNGDTDPLKRSIGLVPQDLALFDELSARENLALFGALYGVTGAAAKRAMDDALELTGLAERARDKVQNFSGGMKRRLNLAAALLHDPSILILDEPTVGVDPQSRNLIFENLETLKSRRKTLIYTTHYMEEAERLCDRIVIVDHGKVIAEDTLQGLYRNLPAANVLAIELAEDYSEIPWSALEALPPVISVERNGNGVLRVAVHDLSEGSAEVLPWLTDHGCEIQHVASERGDLETVFLALTGRNLRDA